MNAFRKVVAIEGKATADGRFLQRGALRMPADGIVPVTMSLSRDEPHALIGRASALQRDDDGNVSLFIAVEEDVSGHNANLNCTMPVVGAATPNRIVIVSTTIQEVHVSRAESAWPELKEIQ